MKRGLDANELQGRCNRAQRLMEAANIDLLLATTEPELRYLTGFQTPFWQSPTRPWFVLLTKEGAPHAIIPAIGADCMARGYISSIRTWASPQPLDEGVSLLADTIRSLAGDRPRIGISKGPETHLRMPLSDYASLGNLLPNASWRDSTAIWQNLRMNKSEAEIEKIGTACRLACDAFESLSQRLRTGMSEIEIFRNMKLAALEAGLDDVPYLVGGAGPGGYGDIISPPTERRIEKGDVLILDIGATVDGYFCDFDRNFAIGEASLAVKEAYKRAYDATEAGLLAAKPGATCADLFHAMNGVLQSGSNTGRLGHGLGMQLTEWPSITADDQTELKPGMVLTLEPGLTYGENKAMVHEENIVIRDDDAELMTKRASAEIPVIE